jgi:predicted N-acyltransferase
MLKQPMSAPARQYACRLFGSIDAVDLSAWERVHVACGEPVFMDIPLIAAVEKGMSHLCRFWHAVIYDDANRPVACASLSAMTIDLANVASPPFDRLLRFLPGGLFVIRNLKILMAGLPFSAGQQNIMLVPGCEVRTVIMLLDDVISTLAAEQHANVIMYKEFDAAGLAQLKVLVERGYGCVASPPMHALVSTFTDFNGYLTCLRGRYRRSIKKSQRKLRTSEIGVSVIDDPGEILALYSPEVHALYEAVVARADIKLEVLSREFFCELARQMPRVIELIVFRKEAKVLAFGWCLHSRSNYHFLFMGLDYALASEFDLYFNLVFASLDRAFAKGASTIYVGQAADAFKARIGCEPEPLHVFVKGLGALGPILRYGLSVIVRAPRVPRRHPLRRGGTHNATGFPGGD